MSAFCFCSPPAGFPYFRILCLPVVEFWQARSSICSDLGFVAEIILLLAGTEE